MATTCCATEGCALPVTSSVSKAVLAGKLDTASNRVSARLLLSAEPQANCGHDAEWDPPQAALGKIDAELFKVLVALGGTVAAVGLRHAIEKLGRK